jgi:ubiquinone/menaquinone biosynthesis C-methylase UbiE
LSGNPAGDKPCAAEGVISSNGVEKSMNYLCPLTGKPLRQAGERLVRGDGAEYRISEGFPVLLGPEVEGCEAPSKDGLYAEAYAEMGFYNAYAEELLKKIRTGPLAASGAEGIQSLERLRTEASAFPHENWLISRMDVNSEWDCYRHIGPVTGKSILQVGGTGVVAVMLLMAGAARATVLTPMLAEARVARSLAEKLGFADKLDCTIGIAEQLPFPDASFDVIFSGGCVHHMVTGSAFREFHRVLAAGGRFAAAEPWRAPLYSLGTRLFGKREANPFCHPLTAERVAPLFTTFSDARCVQHGSITRYPMLALEKAGVRFPLQVAKSVGRMDDAVSSACGLRRFGSGVALLATK